MSKPTTWLDIYEAAGATVTPEGVRINAADTRPFDITLRVHLGEVVTSHEGVRVELVAPDGTRLGFFPEEVRLAGKEAA